MLPWLFKGIECLKRQVAKRVNIDFKQLAFCNPVLCYIQRYRSSCKGKIYLVTGTDIKYARMIADELQVFDGVEASNGRVNLVGEKKAQRLCKIFGEGKFDYIGNSYKDLHVWKYCKTAIPVNTSSRLLQKLKKSHQNVDLIFCANKD